MYRANKPLYSVKGFGQWHRAIVNKELAQSFYTFLGGLECIVNVLSGWPVAWELQSTAHDVWMIRNPLKRTVSIV